jgi:hypothetical protein
MEIVCGGERFTADSIKISKGTWDDGVMKARKKGRKHAIVLTVGW